MRIYINIYPPCSALLRLEHRTLPPWRRCWCGVAGSLMWCGLSTRRCWNDNSRDHSTMLTFRWSSSLFLCHGFTSIDITVVRINEIKPDIKRKVSFDKLQFFWCTFKFKLKQSTLWPELLCNWIILLEIHHIVLVYQHYQNNPHLTHITHLPLTGDQWSAPWSEWTAESHARSLRWLSGSSNKHARSLQPVPTDCGCKCWGGQGVGCGMSTQC